MAVSFRVTPSDENENIEKIRENLISDLSKDFVLGKSRIEELAFGIKVLKLIVIIDDKGGLVDQVEAKIKAYSGVGEADVEEVSLIS
ncbi:MAG: hypothetical protein M1515_05320 [Candidatus Thermoplasmatota archaeon]|nr:hypothetical protein [Candidatus Thermoplasmatota archaeon]